MAIDRFEDGDAPPRARDGDAGPGRRSHADPAALAMLAGPERRAAGSRAYRALAEEAYREADGAGAPEAPELAEVRARHAEAFDRIEATQQPRDVGSVLPKPFNLPVTSGGKVRVAPNATKHIWEETRGLAFGRPVSREQRLAGLAGAVDGATVGNWEQVQVSKGAGADLPASQERGRQPGAEARQVHRRRWLVITMKQLSPPGSPDVEFDACVPLTAAWGNAGAPRYAALQDENGYLELKFHPETGILTEVVLAAAPESRSSKGTSPPAARGPAALCRTSIPVTASRPQGTGW